MSSTVSYWILSSARKTIATLEGRQRLYSRYASNRIKSKWRLFPQGPATLKDNAAACGSIALRKAYRHTSTEEEDFHLQLSPEQVNEVLRAGESAHKILDLVSRAPDSVLRFESNQLAANSPVEDRGGIAACLQTNGLLFGIFDGHGGHACAQAVSERLFYYMAVSLMSQQTLEQMEEAMESMKPLLPILQWLKHPGDSIYKDVTSVHLDHLRVYWQELLNLHMEMGLNTEEALMYSFQRLDSDISLEIQAPLEDEMTRNLSLQVAFSGATACLAHVDGVHLHVANAGDCRAILGVQEDNGMPEVTYHRLRPQDKFLVLASDGLWDMLGNEDVVRLVVEHLAEEGQHKPDLAQRPTNLGLMQSLLQQRKAQGLHAADQNVATRLIRYAIGNNEYGEMEPERLSAMLTLPEDLARMYRDDITVTVVYFNSESIGASSKRS
ncbi:unnamed protein product [Rangifer tarandus platyrhynchus]|uniref:Uncharacterized protein n=3 Tax=Rangifer tarandus platyrhynchus TaxID=3082113 RepID=A0ACB0EP42_RANTA|nr:unnamed protein product [Rangifer tarandus platyrhynchus]CAI9702289.1 unnamed protein product [Rangifer tarandus platyrhynchus]